jgi:hypothetical protein
VADRIWQTMYNYFSSTKHNSNYPQQNATGGLKIL